MSKSEYLCYMIKTPGYSHNLSGSKGAEGYSDLQGVVTYVGITNDMKKRLRQHNGEISGGAKATSRFGDWEVAFYVTGFRDKNEVLSFEWRMHHPDGKRKKDRSYFGVLGRVRGLLETLSQTRFEEREFLLHATEKFQTFVQSREPSLWTALTGSIQITPLLPLSCPFPFPVIPSPPSYTDQIPLDDHV